MPHATRISQDIASLPNKVLPPDPHFEGAIHDYDKLVELVVLVPWHLPGDLWPDLSEMAQSGSEYL